MDRNEYFAIRKKLSESKDVFIRYRVLSELIDTVDPEQIQNSRSDVWHSPVVQKLFNQMHPEGYWLQTNPRTHRTAGDGVEYGAYATTHFILAYLAELGLTRSHPMIEFAANRYLNLQKPDGDWWNYMSCLNGLNIRTFIKLGFRGDDRIQKVIELMLNTLRSDGGFLCDMHEKKRKNKKSCYRGALKMLLAFAELPEYYKHPRCLSLIDYFLDRKVIFNNAASRLAVKELEKFSFPVTWHANLWEVLYALSKMGYADNSSLNEAWELAESRRKNSGLFPMDHSPQQIPVLFGKCGQANEWITFYLLLAYKYRTLEN
jgi:hypothetical protein